MLLQVLGQQDFIHIHQCFQCLTIKNINTIKGAVCSSCGWAYVNYRTIIIRMNRQWHTAQLLIGLSKCIFFELTFMSMDIWTTCSTTKWSAGWEYGLQEKFMNVDTHTGMTALSSKQTCKKKSDDNKAMNHNNYSKKTSNWWHETTLQFYR